MECKFKILRLLLLFVCCVPSVYLNAVRLLGPRLSNGCRNQCGFGYKNLRFILDELIWRISGCGSTCDRWQLKTIAPLFFDWLYVAQVRNTAKKRRSFSELETDNGCCLAARKSGIKGCREQRVCEEITVVNCVGVDKPSPTDGETCLLYILSILVVHCTSQIITL